MFDKIFVCLDGSPLAERVLPLASAVAKATGAAIVLLRVVKNRGEMSAEESYMRDRANRTGAQIRFLLSDDLPAAIIEEIAKNPQAMPVMTTHGRTAWAEALLGSVALQVIRGCKRPVLLHRPLADHPEAPTKIATLVAALDGSKFSEKIIPSAVELAKAFAARLLLVQAVAQQGPIGQVQGDVLESSYLHAKADEIRKKYAIGADWDVLHGDAGDAICRYVNGMQDTLLAMTSHARAGLEKAVFGSVAASCIRHAGVPILLHWPEH
jgi:nucleotide-binding universal stress UspA family protein